MAHLPPTNLDMLDWFSEGERELCASCQQEATVSLPDALACFCLNCGATTLNGVRIDSDRKISIE